MMRILVLYMVQWNIIVTTEDGEKSEFFYSSNKNPLIEYPNRFSFPLSDSSGYDDVTRDMVDGLQDNDKYWVFDAYDGLGEYFPGVPDVPPSEEKPTYFVAIPKSKVVDVTPNVTLKTNPDLEPVKQKYYRGEITFTELEKQLD